MSRRPALPISLHVSGRRVAVVGTGPGADERSARLARAGADLVRLDAGDANADRFSGCFAVVIHPDGPPREDDERAAAAARARGCLVYLHDRPDLSDFSMPALIHRGPLHIAISTSAVAPALARRLREELGRVIADAGDRLDELLRRLEARRAELPSERRGELYGEAARLRIDGRLIIDDEP